MTPVRLPQSPAVSALVGLGMARVEDPQQRTVDVHLAAAFEAPVKRSRRRSGAAVSSASSWSRPSLDEVVGKLALRGELAAGSGGDEGWGGWQLSCSPELWV